MSRAQGDNFRTWTNKGLNDYADRLEKKLHGMKEVKDKWYVFGDFAILAHTQHILKNTVYGGSEWCGKWNGWEVVGDEYRVSMYELDVLKDNGDGTFDVNGLPVLHKYINTKDDANAKNEANDFFRMCKAYAIAG